MHEGMSTEDFIARYTRKIGAQYPEMLLTLREIRALPTQNPPKHEFRRAA